MNGLVYQRVKDVLTQSQSFTPRRNVRLAFRFYRVTPRVGRRLVRGITFIFRDLPLYALEARRRERAHLCLKRVDPRRLLDRLALLEGRQSLFYGILGLACVAEPEVCDRRAFNALNRLRKEGDVTFDCVNDGLARRRQSVHETLARNECLSKSYVRAMMRIFTRVSVDGDVRRICVHDNRGACVYLFRLQQARLSGLTQLRCTRRADLYERERLACFVGGCHAAHDFDGMTIPFFTDAYGDTLRITGRLQIGNALQCDATICYGVSVVFTRAILVSGLEGVHLARAALAHRWRKWIDEHRLRDSVGYAIRLLEVSRGPRTRLCLLCFLTVRGRLRGVWSDGFAAGSKLSRIAFGVFPLYAVLFSVFGGSTPGLVRAFARIVPIKFGPAAFEAKV